MNASALTGSGLPPLACRHWPTPVEARSLPPLVLIHGWGGDSAVWSELIPPLQQRGHDVITLDLPGFGSSPAAEWRLDALLEQMASALPRRCLLLGWSLGGMLATAFAGRYPGRVAGLVTLATNATFAQRDDWTAAMPTRLLRQFCRGFAADPDGTVQQFTALQARGDRWERAVARGLRSRLPAVLPDQWGAALGLLAELDNRDILAKLQMPSLHVFGMEDNLVPVAAAGALREWCPAVSISVLQDTAHVPHLSCPDELASLISSFLRHHMSEETGSVAADVPTATAESPVQPDEYHIDKRQVARSFSRAADTYDQVAHLQRAVGTELMALLPEDHAEGVRVVDVGCGTGRFTAQLAQRYPHALTLGLDLAEGMVGHARQHHAGAAHWLCGDAEAMPCGDGTMDLVFSNFALQWCQDLPRLMAEQYRVLRQGGRLVFSTVGPGSLDELRQAWLAVDNYVHVNRFTPVERVRDALRNAGFTIRSFSVTPRISYYHRLQDLTRELKGLGAHNVNRGRKSGLTGRSQIAALKAAYERWRTPQGLPATWEIVTVVAEKK